MTDVLLWSAVLGTVVTLIVYKHCGLLNIRNTYSLWFNKEYWTNYNIVEAISWIAKAIIIVPGLLFGVQVWWFYVISLVTSAMLIWASERKLLPTLVGFNTLWIYLSMVAILSHFLIEN
jgi:hypothetical protein